MKCQKCETVLPDNVFKCPNCQSIVETASFLSARDDKLANATAKQIAYLRNKKLLDKLEQSDSLNVNNLSIHLTLDDLSSSIDTIKTNNSRELEKLENILLGKTEEVMLQGIKISNLLHRNTDQLKLIKVGVKFLKHRRYNEAIEWWSLNQQNLEPTEKSVQLLLMIFESYTYLLMGNNRKAEELNQKIRSHDLFAKYKQ